MENVNCNGVQIEIKKGNIVKQPDCDAIVNAANAQLRIGGGVAGAIHRAAGSGLEEETRPLAPINPGEAVITGGHQLPNPHIIHCLGPVYGRDKPEDELLANCYRNAISVAEKNDLKSIAFPAISTGAFGYPMKDAAQIALSTVKSSAEICESISLIRFVLFDDESFKVHKNVAEDIFKGTPD